MPKRLSKAEWGRFLKGHHVAALATIGAGGEPVLTPIWYLYRDGKIAGVAVRVAVNAGRMLGQCLAT